MPATSKSQFRLMKAVESGNIKLKGLSKKEAEEYTEDQDYKDLPETNEKNSKAKMNALDHIKNKYIK